MDDDGAPQESAHTKDESFYGSPFNFSSAKSPVSKPAPDRIYLLKHGVPQRHPDVIDRQTFVPRTRKIYGYFVFNNIIVYFLVVSNSHDETFVEENR